MKSFISVALLIIISFFNSFIGCSQTKQIELDDMTKRFKEREFDIDTYKRMAEHWREILAMYPNGYPEFPLNKQTGLVEFEYLKFYEEIPKKVIFDRIHEWAALTFGNINSVLHYENFENGKIILKGQFEVIHKADYAKFFGGLGEGAIRRDCYQTYIFTIKDNKVKLQLTNIEYQFAVISYSGYSTSNRIERESLHSLYPITNSKIEDWKGRLDLIYSTKVKIEGILESLDLYIKGVDKDYDF